MIFEIVEKFNNQPLTLRELSSHLVSSKIVETIWSGTLSFQSIYIPEPVERALREWVVVLPPLLLQDLLEITVKGILQSAARVTPYNSSTIPIIISSLAEVLYTNNFQMFEVWTDLHWNQEARMKILHLLHSRVSGIKKLIFSCYKTPVFQFQEIHYSERFVLQNILNKLPHLRVLIVPYVADDELLAKIGGGCCEQLELLNIEGSWGVTNQGLSALAGQDGGLVIGRAGWVPSHFAQCSEGQRLLGNILKGSPITASQISNLMSRHSGQNGLRTSLANLNIRGTSTDSRGLECLLQNFRNLKRLETEEQNWQNLLAKADCSDCFPSKLPLKSINISRNTYTLLPNIVRLFGELQSLSLHNYTRSEPYLDGQDWLGLLSSLKHLSCLSLTDVDLGEVYPHLHAGLGNQITTFRYTSNMKLVEVGELAVACPNLKTLSVSNSVLSFEVGSGLCSILGRLTNLYLQDITFPANQQTNWKKLIACLKLQHISIHNIRLTDGDISDLIRRGAFTELEEIHISASFHILLSQHSVFKLLETCQRLERIGGICSWSIDNLLDLLNNIRTQHRFKIKMGEVD